MNPIIERLPELLMAQYNRITDNPIFVVQKKIRDYGMDSDYCDDYVWVDCDYNEVKDEKEISEIEELDNKGELKDYTKVYYRDRWEFVTACLTEQGCKDYLAINGHNVKESRIYVESGWRNDEWRAVREFFLEKHKQLGGKA